MRRILSIVWCFLIPHMVFSTDGVTCSYFDVIPPEVRKRVEEMYKLPTTYRPPFLLSAEFPQLISKVAVALHVRRTITPLPVTESKLGGNVYWPQAEKWPVCPRDHVMRTDDDAFVDNAVPYLCPVVQLTKKDVPTLKFPHGKDLFQLLMCTGAHNNNESDETVHTAIFWRTMNSQKVLRSANEDVRWASEGVVPVRQEYSVSPEYILEYPSLNELRLRKLEKRCLKKELNTYLLDKSMQTLFGPAFAAFHVPKSKYPYELWRPMSSGSKLFGYPCRYEHNYSSGHAPIGEGLFVRPANYNFPMYHDGFTPTSSFHIDPIITYEIRVCFTCPSTPSFVDVNLVY